MLLSLLPTAVFAADPTEKTFKKVKSADELVTGQYVLVDENGCSPKELSGKWVTKTTVAVNGDTATASEGIWTITVSTDGVVLTDASNISIAPSGGNNNGIKKGEYKWAVAFANGTFTFSGQGTDTVKLAGNVGSENQYRAYKNKTISDYASSYPCNFTLYKLDTVPARQSGIIALEDIQDGDKVVIFNPANGKTLSTEYTTFYNKGTDVTLTEGKLTGYTDADLWTITKNADGTYTIATTDGKKLSMDTGYTSTPLDKANNTWKVTAVAGKDATYYIDNATRTDKYRLQWYATNNNWSAFTGTGAAFEQQFYLVVDSGSSTPDPDPEPTAPIADGKYVIYNPTSGKAMSADATGTYYRAGKDITLTNGKVTDPAEDLIWTVTSENGVYTIETASGAKLSMNDEKNSLPLDAANTTWKIEKAKTDGQFYLINANRSTYYVEWFAKYTEFTTYTYNASNDGIYSLQFIPVSGSSDPSTGLPNPGDQVVIWNLSAQAALAAQDDNADSPSITKSAPVEIKDGKLVSGNGAAVFTVSKSGDYYRFHNETYGFLCANGTGNNAFYSATASEDADWLVRTCSGGVGGYEMESRTAKYSGHSQWMEYYSDSFKVYSMYKVSDYTIYSFSFYPVADGVSLTGGVVNVPTVVLGDLLDAYVGADYTFTFTVDAPFGVQGDMTAKLGDKTLPVALEGGVYTVTIPAASVTGEKLTVNISGTDTKGKTIAGTADITVKDEPVFADPTPARGSQTGEDKRPTISVSLANAGANPTITMTVGGKTVTPTYANGKVTYVPTADMADGRVDVTVTATRADDKSASFTWFFTVGETQYQRYFGQLHSHTQYSDGSGSLTDALNYIKNIHSNANVQFVAFTDHSNYFDSKTNPNVEAALYDTSLVKDSDSSHSWSTYKSTIAAFNAANTGSLVALGGFEMTWSGGPGHINTFNTPGVVSRNNTTLNNKTNDAGMKAYYALLSQAAGADSISQFNHPGTTFGNFTDFSYWDPVIDSRMYMVEVGNGEGQIGAGGYYPSYEQYIMALDKGWHLAPTNNQDNHKGKWGNANDARDVILVDGEFNEENIYAAIRAMRMYATEDKNLQLNYTVNGLIMGSSITEVPDKLNIEVEVNDPDASDSIAKVEVVVNSGKVAYAWTDAAQLGSGKLSVTLDPTYSYYFIRVTQNDGDLAVTSPVWVGESLKLGISGMTCGTSTPVTGEELTLTTTFFNSESSDATVKSLTYSIGGTVIGTDKTGYAIGKSSTLDVPFKYTPTAARVFTVQVTAVVEQNNVEYIYTKTIDLDVLDADSLVYIGLDGSHHNEYINGNYSDTMGNFQTLANKYSVRLVELMTKDELMNACKNPKFKAIVLTAPSRREKATGNGIDCYAEDELAAIKAYNEKGGVVLVMGYSDFYETAAGGCSVTLTKEQHMAAQQNLLLAALGSKLRLGDDQTADTVHNDGRDYGIYAAGYGKSELLEGLVYSDEAPFDTKYSQVFSQYGGCSVYVVDENGTPVSAVPSTVTPVVYGNATTSSIDGDSDGLGGPNTPKYNGNILLLATEKTGNNGMILVTGGTMMADWQLQVKPEDIDSGADLLYSNYTIMENLLQMLNPVKITPISAVQAQKEEGIKYTVEGIVTSNASGYDKNTAFFDCIYIQDETAGINCFPVAGDFKIGDKVRVSGTTSSYQGERQLAVTKIEKIGEGTPVTPKEVTSTQVNDGSVLGSLVKLKGIVTAIEMAEGKVQTILVRDVQGKVARVFIDGYICPESEVKDLKVGCAIEATGLASYDNTFVLSDGTPMAPRIRISNRADVICTDHSHQFGAWTVTTPAGCTTTGAETRTCACGETETRLLQATGHTDANKDGKCDTCGQPVTPATGDTMNLTLYVTFMALTALAGVTLLASKKRRAQ